MRSWCPDATWPPPTSNKGTEQGNVIMAKFDATKAQVHQLLEPVVEGYVAGFNQRLSSTELSSSSSAAGP
jgi:hypothetical protein